MAESLLEISSVTAGYKPGLPILHDVSISVGAGEIVTLIGPNGAGKSTLVKVVAGLVSIEHGDMRLNGSLINGTKPERMFDHGIAYVPQIDNIFRTLTVRQNLVLAAQRVRGDKVSAITRMFDLFTPLAEFESLKAGGLSGGQRQMLAIAMALVANPDLILMDEPTAGLSPQIVEEVLGLVREAVAGGASVLLVEQNAKAALAISDRAYVLAEGRNQYEGTGPQLLNNPVVGDIYLGAWRREKA